MLVRRIAPAIHRLALLVQRELLVDRVAIALDVAVKVRNVECNEGALRVVPWAAADAVARVDRGLAGRRCSAQVRVPRPAARTRRASQRLTVLIRPGKPAEVGAVTLAGAGDEEAHGLLWLLRLGGVGLRGGGRRREERERGQNASTHWGSLSRSKQPLS